MIGNDDAKELIEVIIYKVGDLLTCCRVYPNTRRVAAGHHRAGAGAGRLCACARTRRYATRRTCARASTMTSDTSRRRTSISTTNKSWVNDLFNNSYCN